MSVMKQAIMRFSCLAVMCAVSACMFPPAAYLAQTAPKGLVLQNVHVITGTHAPHLRDKIVIIKGNRIADIIDARTAREHPGYRVMDLKGKYLIPGLIDSHFHIIPIHSEKALEYALYSGITVVRDMAGDGGYLQDLQQAIRTGEVIGPDVYFSALMAGMDYLKHSANARMCTPPDYELGKAPWMRAVGRQTDIRQVIRDAKNCGATGIKIYNGLSAELVCALTAEAHNQGLKAWAHAVVSPATALDVVRAGVDTISHAVMLLFPDNWTIGEYGGSIAIDREQYSHKRLGEIFSLMKKNNIYLDPTLLLYSRQTTHDPVIMDLVYLTTRMAHEQGVLFVAGTDIFMKNEKRAVHDLHYEMELLVEKAGLSAQDALQAATIHGAEVLGIAATHGSIEKGKIANMVVLTDNPLADIRHTREIDFVIKQGKIYRY